jgi:aspartate kinase
MLLEDPKDVAKTRARRARAIVVQKYGGSSLADVDKLGRVADRIVATRNAGYDVVAVVSAMGKTTDGLLSLAQSVALGEGDAPRRELDMLVSTGERVSMSLLSIAIHARGLDAISFTGSQCGIITNDRHFDARIIEVRPHRIEDELARGRIVVVAGYQGMSYRREITTLGRGGTDTTAVALAAALEAERCEIYSDVDGVYSADPRAVPDARHLPELDYDMLQEMAQSGAKVLCAQAVEWARRAGIAIYARSTFDAPDKPKQTIVRKFDSAAPRARAVTCNTNVAWLSTETLPRVIDKLAEAGVCVAELSARSDGADVLVSLLNAPNWPEARSQLASLASIDERVALVSVIGDGLTDSASTLSQFRRALDDEGCTIKLLLVSSLRIAALIDVERVLEAQQALHAALSR